MKHWIRRWILCLGILVGMTCFPQGLRAEVQLESIGEIKAECYQERIAFVNEQKYYWAANEVMTMEEALQHMRDMAVAKEESITIVVSQEDFDACGAAEMIDKAFAHTDKTKGYEGDAIIYDGFK